MTLLKYLQSTDAQNLLYAVIAIISFENTQYRSILLQSQRIVDDEFQTKY